MANRDMIVENIPVVNFENRRNAFTFMRYEMLPARNKNSDNFIMKHYHVKAVLSPEFTLLTAIAFVQNVRKNTGTCAMRLYDAVSYKYRHPDTAYAQNPYYLAD